ncbi:MAG: diacylglycerol/lipid kinase family protein [Acidimicrobiales bacterium]
MRTDATTVATGADRAPKASRTGSPGTIGPAPPGQVAQGQVEFRRRAAAVAALALFAAVVVVTVWALWGQGWHLLVGFALVVVTVVAAWYAVTRRHVLRWVGTAVAAGGVVALVATVLTSERHGLAVLPLAGLGAGSVLLARYAVRRDRGSIQAAPVPGTPVGPARRGALIMNLRSGGGKAERFNLADECRKRGIEPIVLAPGTDLIELATGAIAQGADVIGMAGGDGSQALVASVAMGADIPLVCIPAGTRNHFALDLGLDRDDVVGALDAFGDAVERRIDLAEVGGRVFVNNVSLGVYAKIVQSPAYRDAKRETTLDLLPGMLGPDAEPFDLRFAGPDGVERTGAQIIQVSNNPYVLTHLGGFGTRARLDTGMLGVAAAEVRGAADVAELVAAEALGQVQHFHGWTEWAAPTFTVASGSPVEAGVDGEALVLDPPLEFRCRPGALRVRLPRHAPGYSPAALRSPSAWWTVTALVRTAAGHPAPIDEVMR